MDTLKKFMKIKKVKKQRKKKNEKLWIKIRDLIRLISKNSDDCDEKYMKIKFNSKDELPLNKPIEIATMVNSCQSCFS